MTINPLRLALLAALATASANAAPVTYTSRAAFEAALATLRATETTETFSSIAPALRGTNLPDADAGPRVGATVGSVTISSPTAIGVQFISGTGNTQLFTGFANSATASERFVSFTVPTPAVAFGIDLVDFSSTLTGTALGASQSVAAFPAFFGVIDPAATATSFSLSQPAARVLNPLTFDNVSFAVLPAAVPEPGSLLLVLGGAAVAAVRSRRRTG